MPYRWNTAGLCFIIHTELKYVLLIGHEIVRRVLHVQFPFHEAGFLMKHVTPIL